MHHPPAILHPRSRTSPHRRYRLNSRLSNQRRGHRSRRHRHLPQRRRPRPPRPWLPQPSRGKLITTLLPQPRIMHHHQNGRLVSMPPEFSLFLSSFYRRLYSSSGPIPVLPFLPSLTSSHSPACRYLRILSCLVLVIFGLRPRCCFPFIYPNCTV